VGKTTDLRLGHSSQAGGCHYDGIVKRRLMETWTGQRMLLSLNGGSVNSPRLSRHPGNLGVAHWPSGAALSASQEENRERDLPARPRGLQPWS
jgi:hypothetical protein